MEQLQGLLPFVLMIVIFYFLLIRPNQKRQKERNLLLSNLRKGDKVITIGGLHGTIHELDENIINLRISDKTYVTFDRGAVNSVVQASTNVSAVPAPEPTTEEGR